MAWTHNGNVGVFFSTKMVSEVGRGLPK